MLNPQHIKSGRDLDKKPRFWSRRRRPLFFRRRSYDQHHRHLKTKVIINYLINLAIVSVIFGLIFILFIFAWTTKDLPNPDKLLERQIEQTTTIYDRKGENILYQLHGDVNRRLIKLTELPDYVKWATITAEDRNFYEHSGFSIKGMTRAFITNLFGSSMQGGSTITQQFVKNAILTSQKTYTRKIKEVILAYRIEKKFTKDEILQMYFNEIPYGSIVYGVEAASQTYFGKSAKDLTLAQAAVLAAMTQRPTYFSPYGTHLDKLFERQRYILNSMVELNHASEKDVETAKREKIEFKPQNESMQAPHFVMYIRELLAEQYGERTAEEAGYKITTTLDLNYQKAAEAAIADQIEKNSKNYNAKNASLVALDTKTGQILALVGSADFYNEDIDGQVNVALRPRQPGSSIKPLVYAVAFDKGYTPETVLYDVETIFKTDTKDYAPKNYDSKEHGAVTMRKALAGSLNIPAVKTLYLAGIDNVLDYTEKFGYTTFADRSRFGLSLVLGGGEVKLLEHTAAYAAYAREGIYHQPMAILKIEDSQGKILYEYKDENDNPGQQVIPAEPIRSLTSILTDNASRAFIFGEKNNLTLADRPVAAKTGTTNDYHDAWTLGYTPSLAAGVWVGNSNNEEMKRGADGSVVAAPIWNQFMRSVLTGTPVENFNPPPANTADKPVLKGELSGAYPIKIDKITGKLATEFTPPELIEEKAYNQFHCILYYVKRDDPRGPAPTDPFADQQFPSWEDGVQAWAKRQGYTQSTDKIPTEYDDVHTAANQPAVEITSPKNGETINSNNLTVTIKAGSLRGIKSAEYYVDDQLIGIVYDNPWTLYASLNNITSGIHTLTVKVYDDVRNSKSANLDFNFLVNNEGTINFSWINPTNNSTLEKRVFPYRLQAKVSSPSKIQKIDWLYSDTNGDNPKTIASLDKPSNTNLEINWLTPPATGDYQLYTLIFRTNGGIMRSEEIRVTVK